MMIGRSIMVVLPSWLNALARCDDVDDSGDDDDDDDNNDNDDDDDNYGDHDDWPINNGLSTILTECIS